MKPPVLQNGEELDLELKGHLPDLIQEYHTVPSQLKNPLLTRAAGTGKGARLIAEQLRLQQVLGDIATGDLDIVWLAGEAANHAAEHILAHTGLPGDEDCGADMAHP